MKNVYEVLLQKELEIKRIRTEIEALRLAAPLLEDQPLEHVLPSLVRQNRWPLTLEDTGSWHSDGA